MSTISPQARQELVTAVAERYQRSTPAERGRILDEFVALTGYHRKHAIRVLNGSSAMPAVRRGRRSVYDEAVTERQGDPGGGVDAARGDRRRLLEGHPQAGRQVRRLPGEIRAVSALRPLPRGGLSHRDRGHRRGVPAPRPRPDGADRGPLAPGWRRGRPEAPGATSQRRLRCVLGLPRSAGVRPEPRPALHGWDGTAGHRASPTALLTPPSTGQVALAMPLAETLWVADEEEPHPSANSLLPRAGKARSRCYLQRTAQRGLGWPLPAELDDAALEARVFRRAAPAHDRVRLDCAYIHRELKRDGVIAAAPLGGVRPGPIRTATAAPSSARSTGSGRDGLRQSVAAGARQRRPPDRCQA